MEMATRQLGAEQPVRVEAGSVALSGTLHPCSDPEGLVIFAHASGSSRCNPRSQFIAAELQRSGFSTLLLDLLTPEEEEIDHITARLRLNMCLLAERLAGATEDLVRRADLRGLRPGYLASSASGAALVAAAQCPEQVGALVLCGGRPEQAGPALERVRAPTLLIVPEGDTQTVDRNKRALVALQTEKRIAVLPGATHVFEEAGSLGKLARVALFWFQRHLTLAERAVGV